MSVFWLTSKLNASTIFVAIAKLADFQLDVHSLYVAAFELQLHKDCLLLLSRLQW